MKKGQSATEYLMTYGWAILAIAIVGALLYTQVFSESAVYKNNSMDIEAVNKCMGNCIFDQSGRNDWDAHNYLIPINDDPCVEGIKLMTTSDVSQEVIEEYNRTCHEVFGELEDTKSEPSEYDLCIQACFDKYS